MQNELLDKKEAKYVFLDIGGVLIENVPPEAALFKGIKLAGIDRFDERLMRKTINQKVKEYEDTRLDGPEMRELIYRPALRAIGLENEENKIMPWVVASIKDAQKFPETDMTLDKLIKNGYTLAIISNEAGNGPEKLKRQGIYDKFTHRIFNSGNLLRKHPEFFKHALFISNASPEKSVYVDDKYLNLLGAASVGMNTILVDRSYQYEKDLMNEIGGFKISNLLELPETVDMIFSNPDKQNKKLEKMLFA